MTNSYTFSSHNYLLTKIFLVLGIVIVMFSLFMVALNYKNHVNTRMQGYDQLLSTLKTTYLYELVKENERQLYILVNSLDKEKIRHEESAFNPVWRAAHKVKMDADHYLYFYNIATGRIDGYPHWEAPEGYQASTRPWFQLLHHPDTDPHWLGPYLEFGSKKRVLTLGQKVISTDGQLLGLMMVDMSVETIDRVLERMAPELNISLFLRDKESKVRFSTVNEAQLKLDRVIENRESEWLHGLFDGIVKTKALTYADWELGIYAPPQRFHHALVDQMLKLMAPICAITIVTVLGIRTLLNIFQQELKLVETNLQQWHHGPLAPAAPRGMPPHSWFVDRSLTTIEQQYNAHHQQLRLDTLTGIQNRRAFDLDLAAMAENQQSPYALLLIDVDKFKHVNDTWGHQFGDNVLARVAQVLTKNLDTHSIYRIGGDEFAALVPVNDDAPLGEQLNRLVLDMRHQKWREQGCHVTLSIGVSIGPNTPCELVNHADKALYRSKENGRDCWSMA